MAVENNIKYSIVIPGIFTVNLFFLVAAGIDFISEPTVENKSALILGLVILGVVYDYCKKLDK